MVPFPSSEKTWSSPPMRATRSLMLMRPRDLVFCEEEKTSFTTNPTPLSSTIARMVLSEDVSVSFASVAWLCFRTLFNPSWKSLYMVMFIMDDKGFSILSKLYLMVISEYDLKS